MAFQIYWIIQILRPGISRSFSFVGPSRLRRQRSGGVYGSADRRAIFVGDLIDRGPAIGEVMEIVEGMLRTGTAQIVMGNHEFNALCYHTPMAEGGYLREHSDKNCERHAATLAYFEKNPGAKERALTWFYTFPLWLDLGFARIVHAACRWRRFEC